MLHSHAPQVLPFPKLESNFFDFGHDVKTNKHGRYKEDVFVFYCAERLNNTLAAVFSIYFPFEASY